jgi:hypothetical protein
LYERAYIIRYFPLGRRLNKVPSVERVDSGRELAVAAAAKRAAAGRDTSAAAAAAAAGAEAGPPEPARPPAAATADGSAVWGWSEDGPPLHSLEAFLAGPPREPQGATDWGFRGLT